jgi:FkbM family methyltransferase
MTLALVEAELARGDLAAAMARCAELVRANPADHRAMSMMGDLAARAGRPSEALHLLELATNLQPSDPELWMKIAQARLDQGGASGAAYAFRRVEVIAPGFPGAAQGRERALSLVEHMGDLDYHPPKMHPIASLSAIYKGVFGYKTDGVFLEIGAFDGETHSNTSFLADIGWSGVYVEPVPEYAAACANRHRNNRVQVINCAVGHEDGEAVLSVAGPLSSLAAHHIEKFEQISWGKGAHGGDLRSVPVLSPNSLLDRFRLDRCDVFVLDVEGYEWQVIEATDLDRFRPTLAIVETRDQSPEFGLAIQAESEAVKAKFLEAGFMILWRDELNIVFHRSA